MKTILVFFTCCLLIFNNLNAQFVQQGGKLVGSPNTGRGRQGHSVAISGDGNTAVVGSPDDNSTLGAAYVYVRNGTSWSQQAKLIGSNSIGSNTQQGSGVAISSDGHTITIGGEGDNTLVGAVWVFSRNGNSWVEETKLVGLNYDGRSYQGQGLALSADGNTLIEGGYGDGGANVFRGAVWVFKRNNGVWQQDGSKLFPLTIGANAYFGYYSAISISNDGNTAVVGSFGADNQIGATWVYERILGTWTLTNKLVGNGYILANNVSQGRSVSISGDGSTIMTGGPGDNSGLGAVWVFIRSGNSWYSRGIKFLFHRPMVSRGLVYH